MQRSYHYDSGGSFNYNPNPNPKRPPRKDEDWQDWIGIIALFLIPLGVTQIVALVWLGTKIRNKMNEQGQDYALQAQQAVQYVRDKADATLQQGQKWGPSKIRKGRFTGTVKTVVGGILALGFGLGLVAASLEFVECLLENEFFGKELFYMVLNLTLCGVGVWMLLSGRELRSRGERYSSYLSYIGANRQVDVVAMAATMDVSVRRLTQDLRKMLATRVLPTGYLDMKAGMLVLTEMGYTPPQPEPEKKEEPASQEDELLREIGLVNHLISDPVIKAKIDRIQEITHKILQYQKTHPQHTQQLRTFLNYYLPTTLKILQSYARLDAQGVEGENISAAKERIEGMMDQVVAGFEKQLDKLFGSDVMDIAADVQVLENMLKKDGLAGEGLKLD